MLSEKFSKLAPSLGSCVFCYNKYFQTVCESQFSPRARVRVCVCSSVCLVVDGEQSFSIRTEVWAAELNSASRRTFVQPIAFWMFSLLFFLFFSSSSSSCSSFSFRTMRCLSTRWKYMWIGSICEQTLYMCDFVFIPFAIPCRAESECLKWTRVHRNAGRSIDFDMSI